MRNLWSSLKRQLISFRNTIGSFGRRQTRESGNSSTTSLKEEVSSPAALVSDEQLEKVSKDLPPAGKAFASNIQSEINEFLQAGGHTTICPPQPADPRLFESVRMPRRGKVDLLSSYERERLSKPEMLSQRMSLSSQDFQAIPGTGAGKIEVGEIYGALAMGKMRQGPSNIYVYCATFDSDSRQAALNALLEELVRKSERERWGVRKPDILIGLANTLLHEMENPRKFATYSDRAYSRAIGLKNHNSWKIYRSRYDDLFSYVKRVINHGDEILARQL